MVIIDCILMAIIGALIAKWIHNLSKGLILMSVICVLYLLMALRTAL